MGNSEKKQKKVKPDSPTWAEEGDAWTYTCIKRRSYFLIAFTIGKQTQETCRELLFDVIRRIKFPHGGDRLQFFSDGNDDYAVVLSDYFRLDMLDYGQLVKHKKKGRLVEKEKRIIFGSPDIDDIETTDVENFNGIARERISRLVRKTKCISKLKRRLVCAWNLFHFYWDFIGQIRRGLTPAMIENLAIEPWTWAKFLQPIR